MSTDEPTTGGSRHTNLNNSVNDSDGGNSPKIGSELPTPYERVSEFHEEYSDRAHLRLSTTHGERLREEYTREFTESYESSAPREWDDPVKGQEVVRREAVTWGTAVLRTLEDYADTRRTTVNLEKGRPSDPEYQEWSVQAETRWFASYQKRYYAQMKGWLRELCGGKRPSGEYTEPDFENPHVALVTLSASSVPNGDRVGPVEHERVRRESWQDVYHTLRNTMRSKGYELGDDWQYDRRSEPHAGERGGGLNHCYGHDHIVIVVDGEVDATDFQPVVEKHVETCDWAGETAHALEKAIEVKAADEVEHLAEYCASYAAIKPVDLLERPIEYVAWASAVNAANVKTVSRSDAAKHAATADACRQRAESPQCDQDRDHAEEIIPSTRRGYELECAECGSPHGIDQDQTLTAARSPNDGPAIADGGLVDRVEQLKERWPSARAGATVGERPQRRRWRLAIEEYLKQNPEADPPEILGQLQLPPDAREVLAEIEAGIDRSVPVGFERPPEWQVKSITVGEEEYPASSGNGVTMVETKLPVERVYEESVLSERDDVTRWRCEKTNVAIGGPNAGRKMAGYLVKQGIKHPWVIESLVVIEHVRGLNSI
ncbi:hypothetical protein GBQ70_07915 [Halomicrobium sp. ZPS1]|uniref:Replication protein n=1 Tax=Halomicrobium mukohataei TaxID=57705 RepID=A0A4D6KCA3_9EURY|nr:hypothetical protein E5139_07920 [Halomicrobium mukohataei]QFR20373.1 hypothetical protein GBQ70_07915 [Halomicrobium sp. ZPS1]